MTHTTEFPPTETVHLATNLNKSDKAHYNLINSPLHKNWDILALQEPYIDSFGNTKANLQWHVIYLSSHLTNSIINRSVILISTSLDINRWAQIPIDGTNNISAV